MDYNWLLFHELWVAGDPVPWSAPDIMVLKRGGRYARKNQALIGWQATIARCARVAWPYEPHAGPIHLSLEFRLKCDDPDREECLVVPVLEWNENQARWSKKGKLPDRTNLVKAVEDGLEGVIFVNDTQVRAGDDVCLWSANPGVYIRVGFIDAENPLR